MNFLSRVGMAAFACMSAAPAWQAYAAENGVAYVTNQGGGVTVLDTRTLKPIADIAVGRDPRGLAVSPDGRWLLTANQGSSDVSVVDTGTRKEVRRIAIGKNVEFLRISPDGHLAFVTYEPSSQGGPPASERKAEKDQDQDEIPAEVAVVDLRRWSVVGRIRAARETEGIEFSPDGKLLVVANEGENTLVAYDIATLEKVRSVDVSPYGSRPRGIKIAPNGKTYVVTMENSDNLLLLDTGLGPIRTVPTERGPYGVAFDREGRYLWVAASRADRLQVFDAQSLTTVAVVPVGKRCWHFSFTPDAQKLLLACGRSNSLHVIDPRRYEVVDTLQSYKMPWGVVTYPASVGSLDAPR